ncbi:MAG: superoxide dismutase family protein [Chloroflexota bacterium]|nr:superoxide dismutase family protein [Chloroflexota bacterium]
MLTSPRIGRSIIAGVLASSLLFGGGALGFAQDATPEATPEAAPVEEEAPPLKAQLTLTGVDGEPVGFGAVEEADGGVTVTVVNSEDSGLAPGEHGIHVHETGICDPSGDEAFSSAGGHFNPTGSTHGGPETEARHGGDLGNMTVNDDGSFTFEVTVKDLALGEGEENTLADEDGSALLIHADPDDLETDPSGESGGRVACGIIFPNTLPVASPVGSPEATPAS